jgi:eukaryotic-like serine/threonine-protein kinase
LLTNQEVGGYRFGERIGAGGWGTVYIAESAGSSGVASGARRVAIKVAHPEVCSRSDFSRKFEREIALGRQVRHPNVVEVLAGHSIEVAGKTLHWVVMEHVEGKTIRQCLESGPCPFGLARHVARELCQGLAAVHAVGAVHRDIKPENVIISGESRVRLMDFGCVRLVSPAPGITDGIAGTVGYIAPEVFAGRIGGAADMYALGLVLYEMCVGANPFLSQGDRAVAANLSGKCPSVLQSRADVPPFLAAVIDWLLQVDPEARPTAGALERILQEGEASDWWRAGAVLQGTDARDVGRIWSQNAAAVLADAMIGASTGAIAGYMISANWLWMLFLGTACSGIAIHVGRWLRAHRHLCSP